MAIPLKNFKLPVWLFYFFSRSFQTVYTKRMYSSPKYIAFFFFSVNCFCLHKMSIFYQGMQSFPDSSSVCSKGSALQCIFILHCKWIVCNAVYTHHANSSIPYLLLLLPCLLCVSRYTHLCTFPCKATPLISKQCPFNVHVLQEL